MAGTVMPSEAYQTICVRSTWRAGAVREWARRSIVMRSLSVSSRTRIAMPKVYQTYRMHHLVRVLGVARHGDRKPQGGFHAVGVGSVLAYDVEGCAMIYRGADDRQTEGDVDRMLEV